MAEPVRAPIAEASDRESGRRPKSLVRLVLGHAGFLVLVDLGLGVISYLFAWLIRTNVSLVATCCG